MSDKPARGNEAEFEKERERRIREALGRLKGGETSLESADELADHIRKVAEGIEMSGSGPKPESFTELVQSVSQENDTGNSISLALKWKGRLIEYFDVD